MTIEEESIQFLESQISNNYKEIFDKYLINNVEWIELEQGMRPVAHIMEATTNKLVNIIVLFPYFNPSTDTTK
jgi:hypothetical protein|tara:strand:+ start:1650 stop:1868 length:219 start_codon:yes stop_codon:yes gene_type:complete